MNTILLVEDNPSFGRLLSGCLEMAGFSVPWVRTNREAVETLEARVCDLVLLDAEMADEQGIEILRQIRALPDKKNVPVVMMTNLSDIDLTDKALSLGATDSIIKANIELEKLVSLIKTKYLRA